MPKARVGDKVEITDIGRQMLAKESVGTPTGPGYVTEVGALTRINFPGVKKVMGGYVLYTRNEFEVMASPTYEDEFKGFLEAARSQFDPSEAEEEAMIWSYENGWNARGRVDNE